MKRNIFSSTVLLLVIGLVSFSSCSDDDNDEKKYGTANPLSSNVSYVPKGYSFEYNAQGLLTAILKETGDTRTRSSVMTTVAEFTYPQVGRAVMSCPESKSQYAFAFGANHFAYKIIEKDDDGEVSVIDIKYDTEGHIIYYDDSGVDRFSMEWSGGNMVRMTDKSIDNEHKAYATLTYTADTDFARYSMSPFLTDYAIWNGSPYGPDLTWFLGSDLCYATQAGFLGKPSVNLPATIVFYDKENKTPAKYQFNYYHYTSTDQEGNDIRVYLWKKELAAE